MASLSLCLALSEVVQRPETRQSLSRTRSYERVRRPGQPNSTMSHYAEAIAAWDVACAPQSDVRCPAWARGLKLRFISKARFAATVRARAGAWIETLSCTGTRLISQVRAPTVAWIETISLSVKDHSQAVRTLTRVWIETAKSVVLP